MSDAETPLPKEASNEPFELVTIDPKGVPLATSESGILDEEKQVISLLSHDDDSEAPSDLDKLEGPALQVCIRLCSNWIQVGDAPA